MIVVDTSAWIAHLRNQKIPCVQHVRNPANIDLLLIGDVVMAEVLQGARDAKDAARLEADVRLFPIVEMVNANRAVSAASHYRAMRAYGFTMALPDLLIGTFCIANNHDLLHNDGHFDAMEKLCGLRVLR